MKSQPKTTDQLRAIFGLGKGLGFGKEDLEQMACELTDGRVERLSLLSFDQANAMIQRLGGDPFPVSGPVPVRTANHRRQKAGVKQIETVKHLNLIDELARLRNMSPEGLERLCMRMIKKPRPTTTAEGNKIVEALKAMNARDRRRSGDTPVPMSAKHEKEAA